MKPTLFFRLIVCTSIFLVSCYRDGPLLTDVPVSDISQKLNDTVPELMRKHHIEGVAVALIRDGRRSLTQYFGYSDVSTAKRIHAATVYKAASLGKPIFAYLVVSLAREGVIDLDAPLYPYIKAHITHQHAGYKSITARMVLSHTTGLPNLGTTLSAQPFHFTPGSAFEYSGHGYLYLQWALESITGKHLNQLANEYVFLPLKMTQTSFVGQEKYSATLAQGYGHNNQPVTFSPLPTQGYSAWSLLTTLGDYSQFVAHIINAAAEPDSIAAQLLVPSIAVTESLQWGLGWGLQNTKPHYSFWHWASTAGFRHYCVGYPDEKLAVIVMSNSARAFSIADDIMVQTIGGHYPSYDWF